MQLELCVLSHRAHILRKLMRDPGAPLERRCGIPLWSSNTSVLHGRDEVGNRIGTDMRPLDKSSAPSCPGGTHREAIYSATTGSRPSRNRE